MIEVEVKIIGMFGADFLTIAKSVAVKDKARPADALAQLYKAGDLPKSVYKQVKRLRPPYYLAVNDVKVDGRPKDVELSDGDTLSVMQVMVGG